LLAGRITSRVRGFSQNSRSRICASKISGGGAISVIGAPRGVVMLRSTPASCCDGGGGTPVRGGRALALAEADGGVAVREAQPISGAATSPRAAMLMPCCKKFLRVAIVVPR